MADNTPIQVQVINTSKQFFLILIEMERLQHRMDKHITLSDDESTYYQVHIPLIVEYFERNLKHWQDRMEEVLHYYDSLKPENYDSEPYKEDNRDVH